MRSIGGVNPHKLILSQEKKPALEQAVLDMTEVSKNEFPSCYKNLKLESWVYSIHVGLLYDFFLVPLWPSKNMHLKDLKSDSSDFIKMKLHDMIISQMWRFTVTG